MKAALSLQVGQKLYEIIEEKIETRETEEKPENIEL